MSAVTLETEAGPPGRPYQHRQERVPCRLCRRIALAVFTLILAVEAVLLIPSASRFEREALHALEMRAATALESVFLLERMAPRSTPMAEALGSLLAQPQILGVVVGDPDGRELAAVGERPTLVPPAGLTQGMTLNWRSEDGRRYDFAWAPVIGGAPLVITVRLDSSGVEGDLFAYLLRIGALTGILVLAVTGGLVLVLHRLLLAPVLQIRASLLAAADEPDQAERFRLRSRRTDELGELIGAYNAMLERITLSRKTERRLAEERARWLEQHDLLTGLPNRGHFIQRLGRFLREAGESGRQVALVVLDLRRFRALNDRFGQGRGDRVLRLAARRLVEAVGPNDVVARLGGDVFGLIRDGCGDPAAMGAAVERLRERLAEPLVFENEALALTCRVGVTVFPTDGRTPEALIENAELALVRAKADPLGGIQFFVPSMTQETRLRLEIERDLARADERGELELHFQPKLALGELGRSPCSGDIAGAEALLRWRHPKLGMVSPGLFIPVAESSGLILDIGRWVLHETCIQLATWDRAGVCLPKVAVNLSGEQFRQPDLVAQVEAALSRSGLTPGRLELEITESVAMRDVERSVAMVGALNRLGVSLSIDDFGTGYSSLSYLRRFEVQAIKIDRSFVADIGRDGHAEAVCDAVIGLGRALGKRVVAEGVELESQLDFLRSRGCHEVQGYLFARPMPPISCAEFLSGLSRASRNSAD